MRLNLTLLGLTTALPLVLGAASAQAAMVTGLLSDNTIVKFDVTDPTMTSGPIAIQGLAVGETVRGIDYRPLDGKLYGLVTKADGTGTRLVTINRNTGMTTAVAPLASNAANNVLDPGVNPVNIRGGLVGVDFNPAADLLRIVTDAEENLRANPGGRVLGGATGATAIDGSLNLGGPPATPLNLVSAAYTNNFANATSTVLYTFDSVSDQLFIQNPPNSGTQSMPISLDVDATGSVGFDILGKMRAFASFGEDDQGALANFYTIDLMTGKTVNLGTIGGQLGNVRVNDIAVTPIPAALPLLASALGGLAFFARRRRAA
jgi:hypothetical protein